MVPERVREADVKIAEKEWGSAFKHGITQRVFSPDSKETLDLFGSSNVSSVGVRVGWGAIHRYQQEEEIFRVEFDWDFLIID